MNSPDSTASPLPDTIDAPSAAEAPPDPRGRLSLAKMMRGPFHIRSLAVTGLFILALFAALYFAKPVIMPLVLAMLLSYLLAPVIRLASRWRIPPALSSAAVLLVLLGSFAMAITYLSVPALGWLQKAPYSIQQIQAKLHPLQGSFARMQAATAEVEKMTAPPGNAPPQVEVKNHAVSTLLMNETPELVATLLSTVILLYFLLASDGMFLRKLMKVMPSFADKRRAVEIAREVESCISRYLGTVTLVNLGLGLCVTVAMALLHLPNPFLWGALVFALHFVPYLGALVGLTAMTLAAVLSFDQLGHALACPGVYLVFAILEAQVVTPMTLGRSLTLNPVVILISLIFWGWIWGVPGALLAVPILATFKIFCDHVEPLAPVAEFLSD